MVLIQEMFWLLINLNALIRGLYFTFLLFWQQINTIDSKIEINRI